MEREAATKPLIPEEEAESRSAVTPMMPTAVEAGAMTAVVAVPPVVAVEAVAAVSESLMTAGVEPAVREAAPLHVVTAAAGSAPLGGRAPPTTDCFEREGQEYDSDGNQVFPGDALLEPRRPNSRAACTSINVLPCVVSRRGPSAEDEAPGAGDPATSPAPPV